MGSLALNKDSPMKTLRALLSVAALAACTLCAIYMALFSFLLVSCYSPSVEKAATWALITMAFLFLAQPLPVFTTLGVGVSVAVAVAVWIKKGYRLWRVAAFMLGCGLLISLLTALLAALFGAHASCSFGF
jgi:hypothetical protein